MKTRLIADHGFALLRLIIWQEIQGYHHRMNTQQNATHATQDRPEAGLSGLGRGIVREAEALDASLDRAFISLREIRMAANRLIAPAPQAGDAGSSGQATVPDALVNQLTAQARDIAATIYQTLNEAGAPPAADAAARKTADGFESVADKIATELSAWNDASPMPPDQVAGILSDCKNAAQSLQRRISGPVGKLMPIMQLRDNLDQRSSHIVAVAELGLGSEGQSRTLVEVCLGAQLHNMSEALDGGGQAVGSAAETISTMTTGLRTQIGLALAGGILPGTCVALETALSNRADWGSFRPLAEESASVETFVADVWTELMVNLGYQWAERHAATEDAAKMTDLLDVSAGLLAAAAALDDESRTMAEAAIRMDNLKEGLETETALAGASDIRDNPVLSALWDCYTVEDERAVHNTLLDRLAS